MQLRTGQVLRLAVNAFVVETGRGPTHGRYLIPVSLVAPTAEYLPEGTALTVHECRDGIYHVRGGPGGLWYRVATDALPLLTQRK